MLRRAITLFAVFAFAPVAHAQVMLAETPTIGECFRYSIELELAGRMTVGQEGAKETIRLEAKARHAFTARTLAVTDGLPARSVRHYHDAIASAVVDIEKIGRSLSEDHRMIVAMRTPEGTSCFSPTGPLTRDELDLVTEHFNPQCLAGLLPGKAVKVGESWNISPAAAQTACAFHSLTRNNLTGKLIGAAGGKATFAIEGTAEGIEHGAKVGLTITATGIFDVTAKRITELTWKQKDEREQGPVAPASQVEAAVVLKRQLLAEVPKELADTAITNVPKGEVPLAMKSLRHADPKGRYSLVYSRVWHITGLTDQHLILRLLDRGEFIAQATVMAWKKADPGKHTPADEFKKATNATPGWSAGRILEDTETTTPDGRWLYRIVAEGKMDGLPVVQSFSIVAGPQGDQTAIIVSMKPEKAKAVGTRDRELLNALVFPKK